MRLPRRTAAAVVGALLLLPLAGCTRPEAGAGAIRPSVTVPTPTSTAPCRHEALGQHLSLAAGATHAYLWGPYSKGTLVKAKAGGPERTRAAQAGALASRELTAAVPLAKDCAGAALLALTADTGASLLGTAGRQIAAGHVNKDTIGGANSLITDLARQAEMLGITVEDRTPTTKQLAAG